jgi:hypothetical protein
MISLKFSSFIDPKALVCRKCIPFVLSLVVGAALGGNARATTIDVNLGVFSFDSLNPGTSQSTGLNQFTIYNFTGANNLAPDFPVADNLVFVQANVNLGQGNMSISNVGSGSVQPYALAELATIQFTSATFSAVLNTTSFLLADGTQVQLSSNAVTATITPGLGADLNAGTDFALITVTGTIVPVNGVPEPGTALFAAIALVFLFVARRVSKRQRPIVSM